MHAIISLLLTLLCCFTLTRSTPKSSPNWEELISTDGVKFSGRNAHASCVFKGEIWVTGGRTAEYVTWNLLNSFKVADVWHSKNGAIWVQVVELTGDFFAQNTEVTQPGPIAPWYERYGHSLNAVDTDGDGKDDMMVLLGGYASSPSNDQWVTRDGVHWVYCGLAPWSPRAWHSTVTFKKKLWLMGGTPLNNEVWVLLNVTKVDRVAPLTRSTYSNYTYELTWQQLPNAPWSPRVGTGLVSQFYFNASRGETILASKERIVLVGGYGGWPAVEPYVARYDGFVSRPDSWESYDGRNWTQLNWNNTFQGRAWMAIEVLHGEDPTVHYPYLNTSEPPKMYLFGGGYIGYRTSSKKRVTTMQAKADAYWSQDGATWVKINYEEGGGTTTVPFFSSQEWTQTIVDTNAKYIGRWGLTALSFNKDTGEKHPGNLYLIAGDYTEGGDFANSVYRSLGGLYCDVEGVICGNNGYCDANRCYCDRFFTGPYCTISSKPTKGASSAAAGSQALLARSALLLGAASAAAVASSLI